MRAWALLLLAACGSKEPAKKPPPDAAVVFTDVAVVWGAGLVPDNVVVEIDGAPAEPTGGAWKGRGKGESPPVVVRLAGPCDSRALPLAARTGDKVRVDDDGKPRIVQIVVDNAPGKAKQVSVGSVTVDLAKPEEAPRLGIPAGCAPAIAIDGVEVGQLAETTATVLIDPAGTTCYQAAFYAEGGDVYDPRPAKVLPFDEGKARLHPLEGTYDEALGVKLERVQEGALDGVLRRAIERVPC